MYFPCQVIYVEFILREVYTVKHVKCMCIFISLNNLFYLLFPPRIIDANR